MAISNMSIYWVPLTVTDGLPLLQPTSRGQLVQLGIVAMSAVDGWQDQYCSASGHRCRNRCKVIIWPWFGFCKKVGRKMVCFSFLDAYFTLGWLGMDQSKGGYANVILVCSAALFMSCLAIAMQLLLQVVRVKTCSVINISCYLYIVHLFC